MDFKTTPENPGTYKVKLFTGVEREAYWNGTGWVDTVNCKHEGRLRSNKQLNKLIREWSLK